MRTDINDVFVQTGIIRLMEAGSVRFVERIMPRAGKTVAANAAVIGSLIYRLSVAGKSYDDISGSDLIIRYQFVPGPAGSHGAIDGNRPYNVAYVGRFTP